MRGSWIIFTTVLSVLLAAPLALAQGVPDYDFDWATIGNVNNSAYQGPFNPIGAPFPQGRGSISYDYRMAREEITTGQWMEFLNTFEPTSHALVLALGRPGHWGGTYDLTYNGPGERYVLRANVPQAANYPVEGVGWRQAAMYCNWLHNNKSSDAASLFTGAYDTSTWGFGSNPGTGPTFTDGGRLPGAKFFLPNFDEWSKAAYYDPNRNGPDQGGWWMYPNQSDSPLLSGAPGVGQTSAGTGDWNIPLGQYPQTQSYYGLLDLSGGVGEWLEEWTLVANQDARMWKGASNNTLFVPNPDLFYQYGGEPPHDSYSNLGFRIASIPSAPIAMTWGMGALFAASRSTRRSA